MITRANASVTVRLVMAAISSFLLRHDLINDNERFDYEPIGSNTYRKYGSR
jgi:hypothetical protein